jgi:hypothetical protein
MKITDYYNEQTKEMKDMVQDPVEEILIDRRSPASPEVMRRWVISADHYLYMLGLIDQQVDEMFEKADAEFAKGAKTVEFPDIKWEWALVVVLTPDTEKEDVIQALRKAHGIEAFEKHLEKEGITLAQLELEERKRQDLWAGLDEAWEQSSLKERCEMFDIDMEKELA